MRGCHHRRHRETFSSVNALTGKLIAASGEVVFVIEPRPPIQPVITPVMHPAVPQGIQPVPAFYGGARPPPPGCPPNGEYVMVKYCGAQTQQAANCLALVGCLFLPAWGAGIICCCMAGCAAQDPKDEKEVYRIGGQHYTLNGTLDTNVGPGGGGRRR